MTTWINCGEAAQRLGVSIKTVRRMIARGDIEARRIGPRLIRINATSIENAFRVLGVVRNA